MPITSIPESLWAEANRRLRLIPELDAAAQMAEVSAAWSTLVEASDWRPGPLALTALAVLQPECEGRAEHYLLGVGRDRVTAAYLKLVSTAEGLDPLGEALPAALALRARALSTRDFRSIARDAAGQPERWRFLLQMLWSWLGDQQLALLEALLLNGEAGARLAASGLAANASMAEAVSLVTRLTAAVPVAHWLALQSGLVELHQPGYAAALMKAALAQPRLAALTPWSRLAAQLEQAQLLAAAGDWTAAQPALLEAQGVIRELQGALAEQRGHLALAAQAADAAGAAFQEALASGATAARRAGLARSCLLAGRPEEALTVVQPDQVAEPPVAEAVLIAAQAQLDLKHSAEAAALMNQLDTHTLVTAYLLSDAARLHWALGQRPEAIAHATRAAELARIDAELYRMAAQWQLEADQTQEARRLAGEAAALQPDRAEVRELFGHTLLLSGEPALAIPHFQSAVVFEPARITAALGLARAALEAGQPILAFDSAQRVLAATPTASQEGAARTLMGLALSAQHKDDEAFDHFRHASVLVPAEPEPWRAMAKHYQGRGETNQAVAALEAGRQALRLNGSDLLGPLLADLGQAYAASGRLTEAIQVLREACQYPAGAGTHRQLGQLLWQQGYVPEAIVAFQQALRLNSSDGVARYALAQALEKNGRLEEAWSAYQQTVLSQPAAAEPYFNLGRLTLVLCRQHYASASALQAAAALRQCVERAPDHAEGYALLAEAQSLAGESEAALQSYECALKLAPSRTDWALGFGEVCLALDLPELAIAALDEALAHAPDDPQVHFALARAYAQNRLWPDVTRTMESALRVNPNNPHWLALLAQGYAQQALHDRAVEAWHAAVLLNPRDAQLQAAYARSLLTLGRAAEARTVYAQALSLGPDVAEVQLDAGLALLEMGEVEQAYHVLVEAARLAPRHVATHAALGQAAALAHHYEAAHTAYSRAAELAPEHTEYWRDAGEALWAMGRLAAAVTTWQRALAANPNDDGVLARLGLAHLRLNQPAEALVALSQVADRKRDDPLVAREAARAALEIDEFDRAIHYLERVVELSPADAETRYLLGRAFAALGQADKALTAFRQAARLAPGEGRYLAVCAETLAALGAMEEATRLVGQALRLSPDTAEVQQLAGDIFLRADQAAEAAQAYGQWSTARPRDPQAQMALARAWITLAENNEYETRTGLTPAVPTASFADRLRTAIHKAAALGGEALPVRALSARAKAVLDDPAEAAAALETLVQPETGEGIRSSEVYRALGQALRKSGQFERARESLQAALRGADATGLAKAYLELGVTLWEVADHRGAMAVFKRAAVTAPDWAIAQQHFAEALWAMGDRTEATQVLSRALTLRPTAAAWHYRLAHMYAEVDEPAKALGHFHRAAELNGASADYALALARALSRDGDIVAALPYFQRAAEARPDDAVLWTEYGQAQLALREYNTAASCFARAILLAPTHVPALLGSARSALALGDTRDAANKAEAAARLAPADSQALICLAEVQVVRGDAAAAEAAFTAAIAQSAQPAAALLALGQLHLTTGQYEKAVVVLQQAVNAAPDSDPTVAALGEAYWAAGYADKALLAFREAGQLAPRRPAYLLRLGQICRAQGQLDQALAHLLQARELAPVDDDVLRETGLVYEQRKQFDRALEMYRAAVALAPEMADNHTRAGVALKHLKDYDGAVAALEQAVALDPKNLEATKQLAVVSALHLMHGQSPRTRGV